MTTLATRINSGIQVRYSVYFLPAEKNKQSGICAKITYNLYTRGQGSQAILIHNKLLRYVSEGADTNILVYPGLIFLDYQGYQPIFFIISPMCSKNISMATSCSWPRPISNSV